jgi:glycosyltransferase involved in cell wall biosynthesis
MSSASPLVSVIIPTYNCAAFIGEAIQSVIHQTMDDYEIIVIDDGSTDQTASLLAQFAGRIRCLRQDNQGVAAARNHGIRSARGRIIGFLDADDRWKPDKLERQIPVLLSADDIGVIFSGHQNLGGQTAGFNQYESPELTKLLSVISLGQHAYLIDDKNLFQKIMRYYLLLTSTVLIKRTCIEHVGAFDESLDIAEDTQLWLRVAKRTKVAFTDLPLTERWSRGESLTGDEAKFTRQIILMFQRLKHWLPDLNAEERAAIRQSLDYWYKKAYQRFCDGDQSFGAGFFWSAILNDRRTSAPFYLLAVTLPDALVQIGWSLDRRLRWYRSKLGKIAWRGGKVSQ